MTNSEARKRAQEAAEAAHVAATIDPAPEVDPSATTRPKVRQIEDSLDGDPGEFITHARADLLRLLDQRDEALAERDALVALVAAAIGAHRDLHVIYGSTAVCGGGVGGQAMTQHCGVTCGYSERHEAQSDRWHAVESAYFRRNDGDPDWAAALTPTTTETGDKS